VYACSPLRKGWAVRLWWAGCYIENGDSWYWFLDRLKQMVVGDVSDVCVIHDGHKGIVQAISDIKEGSEERYRAAQWPDVHSRWCMRHCRMDLPGPTTSVGTRTDYSVVPRDYSACAT
jgi:hypothetical protein